VTSIRESIKRATPRFARDAYIDLRSRLAAAPPEQVVLHPYVAQFDDSEALRLSLVLPSLGSAFLYGGVATGLDIFLQCASRARAETRLVLDDFNSSVDRPHLEKSARRARVEPASVAISPRRSDAQPIVIRRNEVFFAFNWWSALNLRALIDAQHLHFGGERTPLIYLIQEYEPSFHPMSSTHLFARMAFDMKDRLWGVFNSSQLHAFFRAQGHGFEREYVFEPWLSDSLRPYLSGKRPDKLRRILVYGRPGVPRNCFPAVVMGLRAWADRYPRSAGWSVVSAGEHHRPVRLGPTLTMRSLGKLSLEDYAKCLQTSAVGISLMASPHPSYPPLEMAHFGMRALTNRYFCKDLSAAHDNIVSLPDISPDTIADALARACDQFEASPQSGWEGKSHVPGYLDADHFSFLERLAKDLAETSLPERRPLL
jgi:hypothetical protein